MESTGRWQEQWKRVLRYHARLIERSVSPSGTQSIETLVDDAYAFFLNCYHLKDWLKRDPSFSAASADKIEAHVTDNQALALAGDIANASKHLKLSRLRADHPVSRIGGEVAPKMMETFAFDGQERPFDDAQLFVEFGGGRYSVLALASQGVQAWRSFLL